MQLPGSTPTVKVFDGVIGVLTEIPAKKISSEEETWSGLSLMIFYNNWLGAHSQIAPFAELVRFDCRFKFVALIAC
jgi:iron uptake system EfeUOB component EfeO/EfeM